MKKIITTVLICASMLVFSQSGNLSGKINDDHHIALPGAKLTLLPGNYYTISDTEGNYVFLNVPEGNYTLSVDYIGYGRKDYPVQISSESNTNQDVVFDNNVTNIQEVKITGVIQQNQARALNTQKNNSNITNIVSADQVGKFPDANIGDALKRIPGITMQNDQGEARNIIVRGLAPELNSVTLNGNRIPSAEGDNRRVQMDLIPSDMIQLIEVNKTLTPDQDADAIGGSVNLITRTAPNKERISLTAAGGYNPIREKVSSNASFMYGNRFFDKKLGLVINGSYNNQVYGSDNVEAVWDQDDFGNVYMNQMDIRKYDVRRERKSIGANLDYKFDNSNSIKASAIYNWRDDFENRYRLRYNSIKPIYDGEEITGFKADLRSQTKGGIDNNQVKAARLERQIMQNYALSGEHLIGSKIQLNWSGSYARSSEDRPNERYIDFQNKGITFGSDFQGTEQPFLTPNVDITPNKYAFRSLTEQFGYTFEDEITGRVDLRMPFSILSEQKGRLRVGAKARIKNKERENSFFTYEPTDANTGLTNLAAIDHIYFDGAGWSPNPKYVPGYFATRSFLGGLQLNNTSLFEAASDPSEFLGQNYHAKENIYAGYVRWDQNLAENFSYILGARIENTSTDYLGNVTTTDEDENTILAGQRKVENDYTNILPSLTLKYTPTEDLVLRGAFTTSLARPGYYALSPFVSILPEDLEVDAGNPDLKASFAYNYDFMGEYYFKSVGILSFGAFYKKINDFLYVYRDQNFTSAEFAQLFPDIANNLDADQQYIFTQSRNGQSVNVYGFEVALQRQLDFLPGFLSHFGIYANYTYTKSEAKGIEGNAVERTGLSLPGTAPHMFNSSLSWENKRFSARISLNYAAAYLDQVGSDDFTDLYYDKQTFLDANASYAITKNIRFFAEANNLTNQPLRYYQAVGSRTAQMEYYKPRYNFGLKFDF